MSPAGEHDAPDAPVVTRFAPSPTGDLHLGHVRSALEGWRAARKTRGRFLLRLEDIDRSRCREMYAAAIVEDLAWLGLHWDGPIRKQSEHFGDYSRALERLAALGVLYPCFCTRREIQAEIARAGGAPHGEGGPPYPGTCRGLGAAAIAVKQRAGFDYALRLDLTRALALTGPLDWIEEAGNAPGPRIADPAPLGDVVLARKEIPASYHLAVTVDDAIQGVTLVTRGEDLAAATHIHRVLQALLGLPVPRYYHHPLLTDAAGRRLSKRDGALRILTMRESGLSPAEVIATAAGELNRGGDGGRWRRRDIPDHPVAAGRAAPQNQGSRG
jgi:glutamyl-Q tRNA(Asp) synthetase